ncbi:hypothetical protein O181_047572 [Austropuccinia psidii MF-1]|uniref:Uncharacterized protein n=1 Tax=Austropuccinia psidii MF-1 TaxID=1389203 RepID=A0A9Q3DY34_9BASI|nr:hypothetical protein [Austropuccinia psidii MF-1]
MNPLANSQPPSKKFNSKVLPRTPGRYQPVPSTIPPPSPDQSTSGTSLASAISPSPIPHPRKSPMITSQKLHPVVRSSRRREDRSPLPFVTTQMFRRRECWPLRATREDQNVGNEGQYSVSGIFTRVDRNSKEVIM